VTALPRFAALMFLACSTAAQAAPVVGQPAPTFALQNLEGKEVKLADYLGKTVVLEWFNPECPFVVYAHNAGGPLEKLAAEKTNDQVVWLAVNSSAPGREGSGADKNKASKATWKMSHEVLLDESGSAGHAYNATNTPQMAVVDAKGTLVYQGALDNNPLGREKGVTTVNYVTAALDDLAAGRPVKTPETKPYGCSVKYAK
jgi:hypothetical protein